jgi:3-carboxy-cis,cis-muconate cycloisomerase
MQTEVGELAEAAAAGKGGSSTMPHKRNPVGCAAVLTAAMRAPNLVATVFSGMVQEHERALGGWQAEWEALPELARLSGGALAQITAIVSNIEVNTQRLDAHTLVEHASKEAVAKGTTLHDVLSNDERVAQHLSSTQLQALLDPVNYAGQASAFVDAALILHRSNSSRSAS